MWANIWVCYHTGKQRAAMFKHLVLWTWSGWGQHSGNEMTGHCLFSGSFLFFILHVSISFQRHEKRSFNFSTSLKNNVLPKSIVTDETFILGYYPYPIMTFIRIYHWKNIICNDYAMQWLYIKHRAVEYGTNLSCKTKRAKSLSDWSFRFVTMQWLKTACVLCYSNEVC